MGRRCRRWAGCFILLILLLPTVGCGADGGSEPLFEDDFESPDSGWGADQQDAFERGYEAGEYFVDLHEPNWFIWARPGVKLDDVSVEVDVHLVAGSPAGQTGVLCRHADDDNFYYFAVSADGYYAIFRRVDGGDLEVLTGDGSGMLPSPAIKTGEQANHLRAICSGDELSLYANGELLETVTDDAHPQGDVGLGAGSGPEGSVRFQFDDFTVVRP